MARFGRVHALLATGFLALGLYLPLQGAESSADPFEFFAPSVVTSSSERQRLNTGGTLARVVEGRGHALAVFSATPVTADGDRFVRWMRQITLLKKNEYVTAIGRFSSPPRLEDLADLTLDQADLDDLERCRPAKCGLKLSASEIQSLQHSVRASSGSRRDAWQLAFRRLVLARVTQYERAGHRVLGSYADRKTPVSPGATFSSLIDQSLFLRRQVPTFADFLDRWPDVRMPSTESFLYWSKERLGAKDIVSVTHVSLLRGDGRALPEAIAVGKQVFATHYMDGSLSVTAVVGGAGSTRYLAYLNRSDVDVLGGFLGGLVRAVLERRLRAEAPGILSAIRLRLESGDPPPHTSELAE